MIILWECLLHHFVQDSPITQDANMAGLWRGFEHFLRASFPEAQRLSTPYHDPEYEREEYQRFLRGLGYQPVAKAAYGKEIVRSNV